MLMLMHGTGLSCSLGGIFHGVGCTVCVVRLMLSIYAVLTTINPLKMAL
jgi:hypothetical protein